MLELEELLGQYKDDLKKAQQVARDSVDTRHNGVVPKRRYDSSDATVMAMAQGYPLPVHKRFVGSVRQSGFKGTIMLATEPKLKPGVEEYLLSQNVTILRLKYEECLHKIYQDESEVKNAKDKEASTCIAPYSNVKIRWGRFPFLRDALENCKECTGPVLVSDMRDVIFQRDPFGDGAPDVDGLQLFAEHRGVKASHPFVQKPVMKCKKFDFGDNPMLCSGTTIGTRTAILEYLDIMYHEMEKWTLDQNCWSKGNGDDQAIHNYLYFSGAFDKLNPRVYHPRQGLVNTVGSIGTQIVKAHYEVQRGPGKNPANIPYARSFQFSPSQWLGMEFDMIDKEYVT